MNGGPRRSDRRSAAPERFVPEDHRLQHGQARGRQQQQQRQGRGGDRRAMRGRQGQRHGQRRERANSQEMATGNDVPNHVPGGPVIGPYPHLADIFVPVSSAQGNATNAGFTARNNSNRDDTIAGQEPNRFGISIAMLPLVRLLQATLRAEVNAQERLHLGLPSPLRNQNYVIPHHDFVPPALIRWAFVNNPEICEGVGTLPNANYQDFGISPRISEIFGLDQRFPEDDALYDCNDYTRPGKWMIYIKRPHDVARLILLYQNRGRVSGWSAFKMHLERFLHTSEFAMHRQGDRAARRGVIVRPLLDRRLGNEYDPTNPMMGGELCHPDNAVVWIYHPRLLPGCNVKQFVKQNANGIIPMRPMHG